MRHFLHDLITFSLMLATVIVWAVALDLWRH